MKPYLRSVGGQSAVQKVSIGGGIDTSKTTFTTDVSTATYLRNVSSRSFPAMASREGRNQEYDFDLTTPRGIGVRDGSTLLVVDGDKWQRDVTGTLTDIVTFGTASRTNRCTMLQFDAISNLYSIVTDAVNRYAWNGTTVTNLGLKADESTPNPATASTIVTAFRNRLFWGKAKTVYWSALNDIRDYDTADDSGYLTIAEALEDISALSTFNNHVQMFTPNSMYELYGTGPATFELLPIDAGIGCVGQHGITNANGALYFVWYDGVYRYNGGTFSKVSAQLDAYFKEMPTAYASLCKLSADDYYLYCSIPYGSSATANNLLLKYDLRRGLWYVDTGAFYDIATFPNKAIGLTTAGLMWTLLDLDSTADINEDASTTAVSWDWISTAFTPEYLRNKMTVGQIRVAIYLPSGSSATLSYSTDPTATTGFTTLKTFSTSASTQNVYVPVSPSTLHDANWFRLRLAGSGPCIVHFLEIHLRSA